MVGRDVKASHTGYCVRKSLNLKLFSQIEGTISRTTAPVLGLFVLISVHFSC